MPFRIQHVRGTSHHTHAKDLPVNRKGAEPTQALQQPTKQPQNRLRAALTPSKRPRVQPPLPRRLLLRLGELARPG